MTVTLAHSEANSLSFDDSSPAKTVTGWAALDAGASAYYSWVNVQIKVVFGGSADGNATISARYSADSGTTDDTEGIEICEIEYGASETKVKTISFHNFNYLEIGITNGNDAVEDITISAKWEGEKVTIS